MKRFFLTLFLVLLSLPAMAVTVTFQEGVSGYAGTTDTQIKETAATTNYGTQDHGEITHYAANDRTNTLLRFDLSTLPSNITVSSVTLQVRQTTTYANTNVLRGYRLLRNWSESQATWNVYSTGNSWGTAGALNTTSDHDSTESTSLSVGTGNNYYTFPTSTQWQNDIQNFASGSQTNYGWVFISDSPTSSYHDFHHSEYATSADRPLLTIIYTENAGGGSVTNLSVNSDLKIGTDFKVQ